MAKKKDIEQEVFSNEEIYKEISKNYGEGFVMYGGSMICDVESLPTGIVSFDYASGIGGFPQGRIVELFGPESSGKTTMTFYAIRELQQKGENVAFIDAEHSLEPIYMKKLGVDVEKLLIIKPKHGNQALDIATDLIEKRVSLIVIDSLAALVPAEEYEGNISDHQVGAQARLISKWLRMNMSKCERSGTCVVFINQLREKIGMSYGNPTDTPGGRAIKFYSSMRISIKHIGKLMDKDKNHYGNRIRIETIKNKVAIPSRKSEISMYFGKGIDLEEDLIGFGIRWEVLEQNGSWYAYGDQKLGNGLTAAAEFIRNNNLFEEINEKINEKIAEVEGVSIETLRNSVKIESDTKKSKKKKKEEEE